MVRATLQIELGADTGKRMTCANHQTVTVGRTAAADFALGGDGSIANVHFALECRGGVFFVRDLQSPAGTFVNGSRVTEAAVHDGDEIRLGKTAIRVAVNGESSASSATEREPAVQVRYVAEPCESGLTRYTAGDADFQRDTLVQQLMERSSLHLVLNLKHSKLPEAVVGDQVDLLANDALPAEFRAEHSLYVLSHSEDTDIVSLSREAWGLDAASLVMSPLSNDELIEQLKFVFGWYLRPSLLSYHLARAGASLTRKLLGESHAVLCEGKSDDQWSLFPNPTQAPTWQELGILTAPA